MRKYFKHMLSTAIVVMFSVISGHVHAAQAYDSDAALRYAEKHWNDGVGLCSEFVSECLKSGGVNAYSISASALHKQLMASGLGHEYEIDLQSDQSIYLADHPEIQPGDVVFYYCPGCVNIDGKPYIHVVLCNGIDAEGYLKAYSHNNANNGSMRYRYGSRCYACGTAIKKAYIYHFEAKANQKPIGCVDTLVANGNGTFTISGWAVDADRIDQKIAIEIYFDDHEPVANRADMVIYNGTSRPDVMAAGYGSEYCGFEETLSVTQRGRHVMKIYAVDDGGERILLKSDSVDIRNDLKCMLSPSDLTLSVGEEADVRFSYTGGDVASIKAGTNSDIVSFKYDAGIFRVSANNPGNAKLIVIFYDASGNEIQRESVSISVEENKDLTLEYGKDEIVITEGESDVVNFSFKGDGIAGLTVTGEDGNDVCKASISDVKWYVGNACPGKLSVTGLKAGKESVQINMIGEDKQVIASFPIEVTVKQKAPIVVTLPEEEDTALATGTAVQPAEESAESIDESEVIQTDDPLYMRAFRYAKTLYEFSKGKDGESSAKEYIRKRLLKWGWNRYADRILNDL